MPDDKPWRAPDAKPMTFDEMAARAQYEWERAEAAEAEAKAYAAERDTLTARVAELEAENARLRAFVTGYAMRALFSEHERDEQFLLDHDTLLFQRDCDIVEARAALKETDNG